MLDLNHGLFSYRQSMDTIGSEDKVSKDLFEEEIDLVVRISQSSDLPRESKSVKFNNESQDDNS